MKSTSFVQFCYTGKCYQPLALVCFSPVSGWWMNWHFRLNFARPPWGVNFQRSFNFSEFPSYTLSSTCKNFEELGFQVFWFFWVFLRFRPSPCEIIWESFQLFWLSSWLSSPPPPHTHTPMKIESMVFCLWHCRGTETLCQNFCLLWLRFGLHWNLFFFLQVTNVFRCGCAVISVLC